MELSTITFAQLTARMEQWDRHIVGNRTEVLKAEEAARRTYLKWNHTLHNCDATSDPCHVLFSLQKSYFRAKSGLGFVFDNFEKKTNNGRKQKKGFFYA